MDSLNKGVKAGTASTKYCEQLIGVRRSHLEEVVNHMAQDRLNPYGLRKGSATHAVAGTTVPPSIPSRWGE